MESKDNSNALVSRDVGIASDWVDSDGVFEVLQIVAGEGVMEEMWRYAILLVTLLACSQHVAARTWELQTPIDETQPLSKIFLERATLELDASISINADPILLGQQVGPLLQNIKFLLMALSGDIMGFKDVHYSALHTVLCLLCAGRGKQQSGLLLHSRSLWVQAKLIGLEFSPLLNSSIL